jgi:hypothetical protein
MSVFQLFYKMKLKTSKFSKSWYFEASEDIMTKFKSQAFYVIRIKYWKAQIPALWNIGILLHERATQTKHFDGNVQAEIQMSNSF